MDINVHAYENGGERQSMRMNDDPELYYSNCYVTREDAKIVLSQYKDRIKWKEFGDRSIDLGCADGGVTAVLESFLPSNYESLTGVDVNEKMVEFANKNYGNSRWNFKVFDMEGELPRDMVNAYDHVFSFYTMHWIRKQKKVFANIHGMITDGGDCLLTFLAFHPNFSIYQALAATDKWKTYIHDVEDFVSPYHECVEPDTVVFKMMADVGFKNIDVKCKQRTHYFKNIETFTNVQLAVNPYHIPKHLLEEFVKDIEKITRDMRLVHLNSSNVEIVKCHYNLMVVYAQK